MHSYWSHFASSVKASEYFGFGLCFGFGFFWLLFPGLVIRFYTWLHRNKVIMPNKFGVRLCGVLWITLVAAVLIEFLMKK